MAAPLDTLKNAVLANDQLDGRRMLELARDKDGALNLAQMCDGYADMAGREKIKMIVTASIVLKLFLEQHNAQERNAANSKKRKAEEELVPEGEPEGELEGEPESEPEDGEMPEPDPEGEPSGEPSGEAEDGEVPEPTSAPPALVRSLSVDPRSGSV